jgi:hypothetical protein
MNNSPLAVYVPLILLVLALLVFAKLKKESK